jgi:hypothetical protein
VPHTFTLHNKAGAHQAPAFENQDIVRVCLS